MIETDMKKKLKIEREKTLKKRQDLDLQLYLDFQRELLECRVSCVRNYPICEINKMRRKHNAILERLSKRLCIPTILTTLSKMKNINKEIVEFKNK